jgi:lipopolysaccharide export system protein LptA
MLVSVERLRSLILVLAGLLVTGILLFFFYARWQARRFTRDLPGKLGISVQQSTNGFTFSKSEGGHILFTLHAAKTVQYKGSGRAELHDVSITMYAADGSQADRIYGNDFDYDPVNGVVRANGAVQIDMQRPAGSGSGPSADAEEGDTQNTVHVKTADLVLNQKTGLAETSQSLEFRVAEAAGRAIGASFDSRQGILVLQKDVDFESSVNGSPLVVRASHAQFDRSRRLLFLTRSSTEYADSDSSCDHATVSFRPDGSIYRIDAQGHVTMVNDAQKVTSEKAHADLDQKSQPQKVLLSGDVAYFAEDKVRRMHGTAGEGTLTFGPQSNIRHAQLRHTVSLIDEEKAVKENSGAGKQRGNGSTTRDMAASQVDVDFSTAADRRPVAQHILAVGGARLNIHTIHTNTPPEETGVEGDQLFVTLRDGVAVSSLRGTGHTKLTMVSPTGVVQKSTGDTLSMTFADSGKRKATQKSGTTASQPATQLESSEQQGNVVLTRQTPAQGKLPPAEATATAQRVTYEAATQLVRLYGNPRLHDPNGDLTADTIQFERASGNASAFGTVKATYRSDGQIGLTFGGSDPVHVVADHARFDHEKDMVLFFGKPGQDARLWQGADSISAPVLELARTQRTLSAHDNNVSDTKAVRAVFTSLGSAPQLKTVTRGKPGEPSLIRVTSRTLVYSDVRNQASFRGMVDVQTSSGTMRARDMDLYFTGQSARPMGAAKAPAIQANDRLKKQVERIVAKGDVQLKQPGRSGTGDELVYTAQDGKFVLTGTSAAPPRIVDQLHGTVTGASLIFNDRDDSVLVSGDQSKAVTETRTAR